MGFFIIWLNIWWINDLAETHNSLLTGDGKLGYLYSIVYTTTSTVMMSFFNEYFLQTKMIFLPGATEKYNEF